MNPELLVNPISTSPLPAPVWFVELFKVLGFVLHLVPMNLWYAGLVVAVALHVWGCEQGKRFSARLMTQMPIIIALGINFGIVPLLFLQLGYNKTFYPATILMAWPWMAVIGLLIVAYYGVYAYAFGLRHKGGLTAGRRAAGWAAAICFLLMGFLFANAMSLTSHVGRWPALLESHQVAGAPTGLALNLGDPTLWPRWLLMFGLAMGTVAAWVLVDAAWFAGGESAEYRQWTQRFATWHYVASFAWSIVAGWWFALATWLYVLREVPMGTMAVVLTAITVALPGIPMAWLLRRRGQPLGRTEISLLALTQIGVLALYAISRQVVQNVELRSTLDVLSLPTEPQWGPMVMFLLVFVIGLGIVAWMLIQVIKLEPNPQVGAAGKGRE